MSPPTNTILNADCLDALADWPDACVDLVYADPPFNTGRTRTGRKDAKLAYEDAFGSVADYIAHMQPRLEQIVRVLKPIGSLYLHADYRTIHHLKVLLDELLGEAAFVNEIIWVYASGGRATRHFSRKHDTLLLYAPGAAKAGGQFTFNAQSDAVTLPRNQCDACGSELARWNNMKRHTDDDGRVYRTIKSNGKLYRYYDDEPAPVGDVWHISHLQQKDPQRTGYPTQKPRALLDRVIAASSNAGDLVLDPFCGSGTTLVAAEAAGRQWVGIDISPDACNIARNRLAATT